MGLREAIMKTTALPAPRRRKRKQAPLKEESRLCLRQLAAYNAHAQNPYTSYQYPLSRVAAVLVGIFVGRWGDLYVLLSRRADDLKSYAGDTALPGGKRDRGDRSPEDTARREAYEEIGLPRDRHRIPLLCVIEPFISTNDLIVFPVVVLITDPAIKPVLNSPEVAALFSHSLLSLLRVSGTTHPGSAPSAIGDTQADESGIEYHTHEDVPWIGDRHRSVRLHRFRTGREPDIKPLFGLTAAILLRVAIVGYSSHIQPDFEINATNQPALRERIEYAMRTSPALIGACLKEGINFRPQEEDETRARSASRPLIGPRSRL